MTLSLEEVLPYIGEYGRFQQILDLIISLINIPVAMQILIMNFSTIIPTWTCTNNNTFCLFNDTLSANDNRRCHIPRDAWAYTEKKEFSLVTQFDIHCKDEWLLILLPSIYFVGCAIGAIILGWIGDKYGRKILIFPSFTIMMLFGFISSFLPNIYLIVGCRFIIGFFFYGTITQGYILISEVVGSKQRPFACLIVFLSTSIAWCLLALQAYLLMNWKLLSIISTAPYIFINLFYKFVPESIQWLKLHGNTDDVMHIISRIAEWNKKELPDNIVISSSEEISNHKSTPIDIFRTRKLAIQSFIQGYLWLVIVMGYYGLYMAADDLGGSIYRDVVLLTIADIPALFVSIYLCNRFGRKICTLIPLLIGGITCIAIGFIPFENNFKIFRMILGYIGKFFLCLGFNGIYTWSVEIYPTRIRSEGLGFTTVAGRIGSALSPWVAKGLKPIGNWFPFVVLGVPSTIAFVIGLWLPETKQKVSPELIKYKRNVQGNLNVAMETKMETCDI